jgi:hypothetical protein
MLEHYQSFKGAARQPTFRLPTGEIFGGILWNKTL